MRAILRLVIIVSLICLTSCVDFVKGVADGISDKNSSESLSENNFSTVTIDSLYQLSVPKHMKNMPSLHPDASLEYANIFKEAYTVVIEESKQDFINTFKEFQEYDEALSPIENYRDAQKKLFQEAIEDARFEDYGLSEINGQPARQLKLFGKVDNINFYYLIAFVEGNENIYMIMNWTTKERQDKLENVYEYINGTFKTI